MTLWLILTVMSGIAAAFMAVPILRRRDPGSATDPRGLGLFREQLKELDREVANGAISPEDAAVTRAEIERRTLAAAKGQKRVSMTQLSSKGQALCIAIAVGWVAVGSALLYGGIGSPELPSSPEIALDGGSEAGGGTSVAEAQPLGDVTEMTTRLAARLEREPDDLAGWQMLGWSYFKLGRFDEAAQAYGRAVALAPENGDLLSLQAEALVNRDGGSVSDVALALVEKSLALDPSNPRARYLKGVSLDEGGDTAAALDLWLGMLDGAPADATWLPALKEHIRSRALAAGIDLGSRAEALALPDPAPAPSGPTEADMAAAADMTPEARQEMIVGMVGRLADSLKEQPDNLEGWLRLIRSYAVLGDLPAAQAATADAMEVFRDRPEAVAQVQSVAREIGLK